MRALIPFAFVITMAVLGFVAVRFSRRAERLRDRSQMIKDENYLALDHATNLLGRILEYDDSIPSLLPKHKKEAEELIDDFTRRQLKQ